MPNKVHVPLLGDVPKGGLFAGGLAVIGVGGYAWYKHMQNQAAAATTAAQPTTGATAYGYAAYGYGSPYGYAYAMSPYGYGYGPYGYGFGAYGGLGGTYGYGGTTPPVTMTTNAQWAQNASAALTNTGYDATTVATALGLYLNGKPIQQGSTQDNIIQAAIGLEGDPPQSGAGGYPPAVHYTGGGGGQKTGNITVPNVVGLDINQADPILKSVGLTYNTDTAKGKNGYERKISAQKPTAGSQVAKGTHINLTWKYVKS